MSVARKRKAAAARLGIEFQRRYERLVLANGADEVTVAAVDLGQLFNDNAEFVIWALKSVGGLNPPAPEPIRLKRVANANALPDISALVDEQPDSPCVCPPLEAGIIGRDKHMTSCPWHIPAE